MRESKGEHAAQLIDHMKKPEMAQEAQRLLAGTGWLPEPLRTPGLLDAAGALAPTNDADTDAPGGAATDTATKLPAFLIDADDPGVDATDTDTAAIEPQAIAAE